MLSWSADGPASRDSTARQHRDPRGPAMNARDEEEKKLQKEQEEKEALERQLREEAELDALRSQHRQQSEGVELDSRGAILAEEADHRVRMMGAMLGHIEAGEGRRRLLLHYREGLERSAAEAAERSERVRHVKDAELRLCIEEDERRYAFRWLQEQRNELVVNETAKRSKIVSDAVAQRVSSFRSFGDLLEQFRRDAEFAVTEIMWLREGLQVESHKFFPWVGPGEHGAPSAEQSADDVRRLVAQLGAIPHDHSQGAQDSSKYRELLWTYNTCRLNVLHGELCRMTREYNTTVVNHRGGSAPAHSATSSPVRGSPNTRASSNQLFVASPSPRATREGTRSRNIAGFNVLQSNERTRSGVTPSDSASASGASPRARLPELPALVESRLHALEEDARQVCREVCANIQLRGMLERGML